MNSFFKALAIGAVVASASVPAQAQSGFCAGFEDGWRVTFENRGKIVAITPLCPLPRINGDTYQAGFERGMTAALGYIAQRG